MKASESLQNDESTANEMALHRAVDTTPAFIHTGRPDGYLDYFNRRGLRLARSCPGVYNFKAAQEKGWERETRHPAHSI